MEQSLSCEDDSHLASQEIPRLLWNPKVHYCVHKNPALDPILSQMNPVHTISVTFILILSFHICLYLQSGLISSGI
jgi:hypothetical protein